MNFWKQWFDDTPDPQKLEAAGIKSAIFTDALETAKKEPGKGAQLLLLQKIGNAASTSTYTVSEARRNAKSAASRIGWGIVLGGAAIGFGLGTLAAVAIASALAIPAAGAGVVGMAGAAVLATVGSAIQGRMEGTAVARFNNENEEYLKTLTLVSVEASGRSAKLVDNDLAEIGASPEAPEIFTRYPGLKAAFDKQADAKTTPPAAKSGMPLNIPAFPG